MKRQKRDGQERAFNHGFKAAMLGKSLNDCPHGEKNMRFQWTVGWREGRQARWEGMTGVAGLHKLSV
ncbi:MAG TPA: ribosome modulation factor [Pseudomonadales bacterium]